MKVGIPKEVGATERRVAATPASVQQLQKLGFEVVVETGAGEGAGLSDGDYDKAGATVSGSAAAVFGDCEVVLGVRPPTDDQIDMMNEGTTLISFLSPAQNEKLVQRLAERKITALAVDQVPRITRAQKMDALSSMANVAGYRAVVEAAQHFGRFFTGQITAAGKVPPAKVLVIGAGVAGLAAIATARSMGAIVRAFDTRPEVKEQVESTGGEFLALEVTEEGSGVGGYAKVMSPEFIKAEMALFADQAREVDIIITTALIPGKPAPTLITADTVALMKPGSVIVDLAAEQGGNCELTRPDAVRDAHGVTIIGYTDLTSRLAAQSSQLYATNLRHLLTDMTPAKDGRLVIDMEDEVIRGATVVKDGQVTWPPPPPRISAAPTQAAATATATAATAPAEPKAGAQSGRKAAQGTVRRDSRSAAGPIGAAALGAAALIGLGLTAPPDFMAHFTVFVLACFVGYMVIWNVTPALHTPLMSVTNAISSIIIIGAVVQISTDEPLVVWIAGLTVFLTSINIAGGFAVTRRMLVMFRK
jgi:NAD(P) transhydrogenase subunit alpha